MLTKYDVVFTKKAAKGLLMIPAFVRENALRKLKELASNPYNENNNVKKLQGFADCYRLRIGVYRIIYRIKPHEKILEIISIAHRQGVYK